MTTAEFSDKFDTLVNSYRRFKDFDKQEILDSIEFDEYEKSVWLTASQRDIVISYYNGRNPAGLSFESVEEVRRYLEGLVKTWESSTTTTGLGVAPSSVFFELPEDLAFITLEQVVLDDEGKCWDGKIVNVIPARQDEYARLRKNPFRGPTENRALRLDCGDNKVEIIAKHPIGSYLIRYLAKPEPIILEDLPNGLTIDGEDTAKTCQLNEQLHQTILEHAVDLALQSKRLYIRASS